MRRGPSPSQIDDRERLNHLDRGIAADSEVVFVEEKLARAAVALIAEHRLDETDLQRAAEIEHAEAAVRHAAPCIAEPARAPCRAPAGRRSG